MVDACVAAHACVDLGEFVRGVAEIPYEVHLAAGGRITRDKLSATTRAAYRNVVNLLR